MQNELQTLGDLTNLTRFMFFKGNAGVAQIVNFAIPMVISLAVWQCRGRLGKAGEPHSKAGQCAGSRRQDAEEIDERKRRL